MSDCQLLPGMDLVSRMTSTSLWSVTNMISGLVDSLADIKVIMKQEMKEEMLAIDINDKDSTLRLQHNTCASIDSGIEADFSADLEDVEDVEDDGLEIDSETGLEVICLEEVGWHCQPEDGWMVLYNRVYHISPQLLERHPGGREVLAEYLGYDGTLAFRGVGHSRAALAMLQTSLIGILPKEERLNFHS